MITLALLPNGFAVLDEDLAVIFKGLMREDGVSVLDMFPARRTVSLDELTHIAMGVSHLLESQVDAVRGPTNPLEEHGL